MINNDFGAVIDPQRIILRQKKLVGFSSGINGS